MADKFQLKALITGVDKLSPMLKGIGQNAGKLRKQLESSGLGKITMGDIAGGGVFAMPFIAGVKAAISFESKMADVKKVMKFDQGQEVQQFAAMNKEVLALTRELPMAADGIAAIYAAGGQSGIARTELKAFATDAIKMGVAFDQTADESGKMMATWRTAFKMGQGQVVELADKINYLGNNGPATTKQISAIVTRVGSLGGVAGMTTGQVAAMGAALTGVGVGEEIAATGIKNFTMALNAGASATKGQAAMFKALRLDAKSLAKGMQTDAQGTILKVMGAISKVDKDKQMAVLATIFGKESIESIAPLLTNLELLEKNFKMVGDAQAYTGSMSDEYAARVDTAENKVKLMVQGATELGITLGNVLLPAFKNSTGEATSLLHGVTDLVAANPWLVKTVAGAAAGFVGLRLAVMGGVVAMKLLSAVTAMSPVGLIVRGIALGAGLLIANWSTVGPFFEGFWNFVQPLFELGWIVLKEIFAWSPMALVVKNWEPIVAWFSKMWERIKPYVGWIGDAANWVRGNAVEAVDSYKMQQAVSALPVVNTSDVAAGVASRMASGATSPIQAAKSPLPAAAATSFVQQIKSPLPPAATSPVQQAKSPLPAAAAAQKAKVEGQLVVKFENAPPGTKVQSAQTNQPGFNINAPVGTRSLSLPY